MVNNKINLLDNSTIDKIAAGEVVEKPASIIKELVENSLDSGATNIEVEIKNGGKTYIRVTDNGSGIGSSEVKKAFLRHATSKIKDEDDLNNINTLGFRGEALAAISAVTRLEILTRTEEEPFGTKMVIEGSTIKSKEPQGAQRGTTLYLRDLFFNVPARRKFLKSDHAETIAISDFMNKIAVGNPHVKFKYIVNGKITMMSPGDGSLQNAVRSVYGKDVSENLIEVNTETDIFSLEGYICSNRVYRSNRNMQIIFINGRLVRSKIILDAINTAYKSILPINKFGICFLKLVISPHSVDVNIHPAKLEVKFENEKEIYDQLTDYLRGILMISNLSGGKSVSEYAYSKIAVSEDEIGLSPKNFTLRDIDLGEEPVTQKDIDTFNSFVKGDIDLSFTGNKAAGKDEEAENTASEKEGTVEGESAENTISGKEEMADMKTDTAITGTENCDDVENLQSDNTQRDFKDAPDELSSFKILDPKDLEVKDNDEDTDRKFSKKYRIDVDDAWEGIPEDCVKTDDIEDGIVTENFGEFISVEKAVEDRGFSSLEEIEPARKYPETVQKKMFTDDVVKNLPYSGYEFKGIVFDTYVVLQKNRSMYLLDQHAAHERILFEKYMKSYSESSIDSQGLLTPIIMEVNSVDNLLIEKNMEIFKRFGFDIESYGQRHIAIRSVPNIFGMPESENFMLEIIDNIDDIDSAYSLKLDELAQMACKSAIKANDKIEKIHVESLLEELNKCENPHTCPHGRPLIVEITLIEIEKMFKRRM